MLSNEEARAVRTLIIRLFSPVGEQVTRLQGLVQQPGRRAVRFLGGEQLLEVVRSLAGDDGGSTEDPHTAAVQDGDPASVDRP